MQGHNVLVELLIVGVIMITMAPVHALPLLTKTEPTRETRRELDVEWSTRPQIRGDDVSIFEDQVTPSSNQTLLHPFERNDSRTNPILNSSDMAKQANVTLTENPLKTTSMITNETEVLDKFGINTNTQDATLGKGDGILPQRYYETLPRNEKASTELYVTRTVNESHETEEQTKIPEELIDTVTVNRKEQRRNKEQPGENSALPVGGQQFNETRYENMEKLEEKIVKGIFNQNKNIELKSESTVSSQREMGPVYATNDTDKDRFTFAKKVAGKIMDVVSTGSQEEERENLKKPKHSEMVNNKSSFKFQASQTTTTNDSRLKLQNNSSNVVENVTSNQMSRLQEQIFPEVKKFIDLSKKNMFVENTSEVVFENDPNRSEENVTLNVVENKVGKKYSVMSKYIKQTVETNVKVPHSELSKLQIITKFNGTSFITNTLNPNTPGLKFNVNTEDKASNKMNSSHEQLKDENRRESITSVLRLINESVSRIGDRDSSGHVTELSIRKNVENIGIDTFVESSLIHPEKIVPGSVTQVGNLSEKVNDFKTEQERDVVKDKLLMDGPILTSKTANRRESVILYSENDHTNLKDGFNETTGRVGNHSFHSVNRAFERYSEYGTETVLKITESTNLSSTSGDRKEESGSLKNSSFSEAKPKSNENLGIDKTESNSENSRIVVITNESMAEGIETTTKSSLLENLSSVIPHDNMGDTVHKVTTVTNSTAKRDQQSGDNSSSLNIDNAMSSQATTFDSASTDTQSSEPMDNFTRGTENKLTAETENVSVRNNAYNNLGMYLTGRHFENETNKIRTGKNGTNLNNDKNKNYNATNYFAAIEMQKSDQTTENSSLGRKLEDGETNDKIYQNGTGSVSSPVVLQAVSTLNTNKDTKITGVKVGIYNTTRLTESNTERYPLQGENRQLHLELQKGKRRESLIAELFQVLPEENKKVKQINVTNLKHNETIVKEMEWYLKGNRPKLLEALLLFNNVTTEGRSQSNGSKYALFKGEIDELDAPNTTMQTTEDIQLTISAGGSQEFAHKIKQPSNSNGIKQTQEASKNKNEGTNGSISQLNRFSNSSEKIRPIYRNNFQSNFQKLNNGKNTTEPTVPTENLSTQEGDNFSLLDTEKTPTLKVNHSFIETAHEYTEHNLNEHERPEKLTLKHSTDRELNDNTSQVQEDISDEDSVELASTKDGEVASTIVQSYINATAVETSGISNGSGYTEEDKVSVETENFRLKNKGGLTEDKRDLYDPSSLSTTGIDKSKYDAKREEMQEPNKTTYLKVQWNNSNSNFNSFENKSNKLSVESCRKFVENLIQIFLNSMIGQGNTENTINSNKIQDERERRRKASEPLYEIMLNGDNAKGTQKPQYKDISPGTEPNINYSVYIKTPENQLFILLSEKTGNENNEASLENNVESYVPEDSSETESSQFRTQGTQTYSDEAYTEPTKDNVDTSNPQDTGEPFIRFHLNQHEDNKRPDTPTLLHENQEPDQTEEMPTSRQGSEIYDKSEKKGTNNNSQFEGRFSVKFYNDDAVISFSLRDKLDADLNGNKLHNKQHPKEKLSAHNLSTYLASIDLDRFQISVDNYSPDNRQSALFENQLSREFPTKVEGKSVNNYFVLNLNHVEPTKTPEMESLVMEIDSKLLHQLNGKSFEINVDFNNETGEKDHFKGTLLKKNSEIFTKHRETDKSKKRSYTQELFMDFTANNDNHREEGQRSKYNKARGILKYNPNFVDNESRKPFLSNIQLNNAKQIIKNMEIPKIKMMRGTEIPHRNNINYEWRNRNRKAQFESLLRKLMKEVGENVRSEVHPPYYTNNVRILQSRLISHMESPYDERELMQSGKGQTYAYLSPASPEARTKEEWNMYNEKPHKGTFESQKGRKISETAEYIETRKQGRGDGRTIFRAWTDWHEFLEESVRHTLDLNPDKESVQEWKNLSNRKLRKISEKMVNPQFTRRKCWCITDYERSGNAIGLKQDVKLVEDGGYFVHKTPRQLFAQDRSYSNRENWNAGGIREPRRNIIRGLGRDVMGIGTGRNKTLKWLQENRGFRDSRLRNTPKDKPNYLRDLELHKSIATSKGLNTSYNKTEN